MTLTDIKFERRPNYVPRLRGKDELALECKVKDSWKGGSSQNDYFSKTSINKPKDLGSWEILRAPMLPRSFNKSCFQG